MERSVAIDIVRKNWPDGRHQLSEALETLIPELKESEDERVRKKIIATIHLYYGEPLEDEAKEMIVWLEKQGSQNLANSEKTCKDLQEPKFKMGDTIIEKDFDECGCGTIIDIKDGKYIFDNGGFICIEEQGLWQLAEQNPAWSEEDEFGFHDAMWAIEQARTIAKNENDMGNLWYAGNWLKSLKGKMQPQPKWSEKYIADVFEKVGLAKIVREQGCDDLTNAVQHAMIKLSKFSMPQQNLAWSEEDEKMIEFWNLYYEHKVGDMPNKDVVENLEKFQEWLKSLKDRYTWKPSDEQMQALDDVISSRDIKYDILSELWKDLKKLKG